MLEESRVGVLGFAVGERIDRLEIRMGEITTKLSKVNMEKNFHSDSDHVSQKQTIKNHLNMSHSILMNALTKLNSLQDSSQLSLRRKIREQ